MKMKDPWVTQDFDEEVVDQLSVSIEDRIKEQEELSLQQATPLRWKEIPFFSEGINSHKMVALGKVCEYVYGREFNQLSVEEKQDLAQVEAITVYADGEVDVRRSTDATIHAENKTF